MAVLFDREAVDNFVERAIASASDDELASLDGGSLSHYRGVAGRSRFLKLGFYAAQGKNAACFVEHTAAAASTVAGVGVMNQQSVAKVWLHRPSRGAR
jgi:hypothetical protein